MNNGVNEKGTKMGDAKRKEKLKEEHAQMETILYNPANIEIKKFSSHKQDKILCIYVPVTWPFVHTLLSISLFFSVHPLRIPFCPLFVN